MQLFVLGMHRSGTSAVTRVLNLAGAYFGPEGMSNGADEGNPKGFWERRDVRATCDKLLQDSGFDWWKLSGFSLDKIPEEVRERHLPGFRKTLLELDAHRPWVVKEPRFSLLFELFRPLFEVPVCLHVVREPLEVAESLRVRNGFPAPVGLALWEAYTLSAFSATLGLPRLLVRYDDLIAQPVPTVSRLLEQLADLGVQGLRVPSEREVTAFLTPELHRARRSSDQRGQWLNHQQADLAALVDDGQILERTDFGAASDGALETLRAFEDDQARRGQVDELEQRLAAVEVRAQEARAAAAERSAAEKERAAAAEKQAAAADNQAAAAEKRIAGLEKRARTAEERALATGERLTQARRDENGRRRAASRALGRAEDRARALNSSRSWRLTQRIGAVRRTLTPGAPARGKGQIDTVIADIARARAELEREAG